MNGHFQVNWKLQLHWFLTFAVQLAIYVYFIYEIFVEVALENLKAIAFGGRENEEEMRAFYCMSRPHHFLCTFILGY